MNDRIDSHPRLQKSTAYICALWEETFPNEEQRVRRRLEKRREAAQKHKEMTEEELEELQASIPDWKRNAVVAVDVEAAEEAERSFISRMYNRTKERISNTDTAKELY